MTNYEYLYETLAAVRETCFTHEEDVTDAMGVCEGEALPPISEDDDLPF